MPDDLRRAIASLVRKSETGFDAWYRKFAEHNGLDPNPDDPRHMYDYRAAYAAGAMPVLDQVDGMLHLPSQFKAKNHPNRFVEMNGVVTDTITGRPR